MYVSNLVVKERKVEKKSERERRKERKKEGKNRKKEELWFNVELKQVCFPYAGSVKYLLY